MNVLLADDHAISVNGIELELKKIPEINQIFKAYDGEQALQTALANPIDLVIIDYEMPKKDGASVISELRKQNYSAGFIMVTYFLKADESLLNKIYKDVRIVLDKAKFETDLATALSVAKEDGYFFSESIQKQIDSYNQSFENFNNQYRIVSELTLREKDILCLLTHGFNNRQIARKLQIKYTTVRKHREHIYEKMGVKNIQALIKKVANVDQKAFCNEALL